MRLLAINCLRNLDEIVGQSISIHNVASVCVMASQMLSAAAPVAAGPSHSDPVKTQLKLDMGLWNVVRGAYKMKRWDKDKAVVDALVEAGADVNLKLFDGADVDFMNWYQMPPVDLKVEVKGVDYTTIFPFPWDREEWTAEEDEVEVRWDGLLLTQAVVHNHQSMVQLLLELGANPKPMALLDACTTEMMYTLIQAGCNPSDGMPDAVYSITPLASLVMCEPPPSDSGWGNNGDLSFVKLLVSQSGFYL